MQNTSELNLHDLFQQMPGHVWLKDLNLNYIAISKSVTDFMGVKNDHVLGKNDQQLPWSEYTSIYQGADKLAIAQNKMIRVIEPLINNKNDEYVAITNKSIFKNSDQTIIGIIGYINHIKSYNITKFISENFQADLASGINCQSYILCDHYDQFGLTNREGQCLFYLARGKTMPEIATHLNISKRTVEVYIDNIKRKFNCRTKSDIVDKAIESGLINLIPSEYLIKRMA